MKGEMPPFRDLKYRPRLAELTARQFIVLQLLACGLADKEVASVVGIRVATVKHHASHLIRALGLYRRQQLVRVVFENQLFAPEAAERMLRAPSSPRGTCKRASIVSYIEADRSVSFNSENAAHRKAATPYLTG